MLNLRRIALAQMNSSTNPTQNFEQAEKFTHSAKEQLAKFIFFPENFNFMGRLGDSLKQAQSLEGEYMSKYKSLAKACNIWMSLGGFQETGPSSDKHYNTHVIIDNFGEIKATYRKIHLFDVKLSEKSQIFESRFVQPGSSIAPPLDSPIGKLGLSICYDIRFPELYRKLSLQGAEILIIPAAFMEKTGYAHWEVLLRARAIENGCFVIASAQDGTHEGGRVSYGHTCVIDPWGTIIAQASEEARLLIADIDLGMITKSREKIPTLQHVRLISQ